MTSQITSINKQSKDASLCKTSVRPAIKSHHRNTYLTNTYQRTSKFSLKTNTTNNKTQESTSSKVDKLHKSSSQISPIPQQHNSTKSSVSQISPRRSNNSSENNQSIKSRQSEIKTQDNIRN